MRYRGVRWEKTFGNEDLMQSSGEGMIKLVGSTAVALLFLVSEAVGQTTSDGQRTDGARIQGAGQHLVVVTEEADATAGYLVRMERAQRGSRPRTAGEDVWRQVGSPVPVVVGRGGIGPKREGDGRSPQGAFELGRVFGYGNDPPPGSSLPYEPQSPGSVCVDDPGSAFYNRVFDADTLRAARDWESAEAMRRDLAHGDDLYEWGVVVRYNEPAEPGAGSCIFLHVWWSPESPTAGCTAMARGDLLETLAWLDPERHPVLIQGTHAFLQELRADGVLPYPVPTRLRRPRRPSSGPP